MNPAGGPDPWRMSFDEYSRYTQHFVSLNPQNGCLSGQQARDFFMRSNLAQNVLAQIWNLSDLNADGRLDRREFCIAMHLLLKAKLGLAIPAVLPESMEVEPVPPAHQQPGPPPMMAQPNMMVQHQPRSIGMQPMAGAGFVAQAPVPVMQGYGTMPPQAPGFGRLQHMPSLGSTPQLNRVDWSIQQQFRLKCSQEFNAIDRQKTGFITGVQARNILTQSGLANPILAQIWNLSDMDKDGRLSSDEFCVAMFLIDKMKSGEVASLPPSLPRDTISSLAARQRSTSVISADGRLTPSNDSEVQQATFAHTFEDKRKENFDRGQAELERRRQVLQEQERREREERERKEREEAEKRERERQEVERRRQVELEKQMELQRQEEARREEEYRKLAEQREVARREMERQRHIELERHRLHELMIQRQREQETNCHVKQKQKTAQFQLQALSEHAQELDRTAVEIRQKIMVITSTIEGMKQERDSKLADMDASKRQIQELNISLAQNQLELKHVKAEREKSAISTPVEQKILQLDKMSNEKVASVQNLRAMLTSIKSDIDQRAGGDKTVMINKRDQAEQALRDESELNRDLVAKIGQRQSKLAPLVAEARKKSIPAATAAGFDDAFGADQFGASGGNQFETSGFSDDGWATSGTSAPQPTTETNSTRKYRALYEFAARGNDELSFQPGDTILVFHDHKGEPGWLAGQLRDKVGWFPEAFAEPLDSPSFSPETETGLELLSPQGTSKLEPINEETLSMNEDLSSTAAGRQPPAMMTSSMSNGVAKKQSVSESPGRTGTLSGTMQPQPATAQFHWKGKKDDHLSFAKGDAVLVLEMQEMWWFGETNDGKRGWFPKSYVRLNTDSGDRRSSDANRISLSTSSDTVGSGGDVKSLARKFDSLEFPPQSPRQPERRQSNSTTSQNATGLETGEWYRSLYPFPEMEPGDLKFETGDDILVVEKPDGAEWWTGICNGRRGVFPANYVQKIPEEEARKKSLSQKSNKTPSIEIVHTPTSPSQHEVCEVVKAIAPFKASGVNQLSLETGDWIKVRSKSPTGWWEGELQQKKGATSAEKMIGWFPGNYVVQLDRKDALKSSSQPSSLESSSSVIHLPSVAAAGQVTVVAMFDYVAQQEDELSLTRGQTLLVLDRPDDDWWTGETMDGLKRGVFPATYVQLAGGASVAAAPSSTTTETPTTTKNDDSPSLDIR